VSYLTCPRCGLTLFDPNPLASPRRCPRCHNRGVTVEFERLATLRGGATASALDSQPKPPVDGTDPARGGVAREAENPGRD